jgi:hypothetical protein
MSKRLRDDDASHPAVEKVECVEADLKECYSRVVARREENEWDHVGSSKNACPASNLRYECCRIGIAIVQNAAICDVACHIQDQNECMKSRW